MSIKDKKSRLAYEFHPLELAIIGYSGAGKTTLIQSLVKRLSSSWNIAYLKHDAHRFEMDQEGKDTFLVKKAGAIAIAISDASHHARIVDGKLSLFDQKTDFLDADALLIEGYKQLPVPKLCLISEKAKVWEELSEDLKETIQAFIGPEPKAPAGLPFERPYFCRDDIAGIANWIENFWSQKLQSRPIKGLVLAGGMSQRMGRDKAKLNYHGREQALWAYEQLEIAGVEAFLSVRDAEQKASIDARYQTIKDRFYGFGPLSGILSAMEEDKQAAWLIVACDLPLFDQAALTQLLSQRNAKRMATAFVSSHDGLPEPLAAIYEPKSRAKLYQAIALGISCPRKVLIHSNTELLTPLYPLALENANTPEDFHILSERLKIETNHANP